MNNTPMDNLPVFFRDCLLGSDGIDFSRHDLTGVIIARSEVMAVSFREAICRKATLTWNDFKSCDFTQCDLTESDFRGSLIHDSVFCGANLSGADMRKTEFKRCDFSSAVFRGTRLTYFQAMRLKLSATQRREAILTWFGGDLPPECPTA
ncbi:MAG: pentapeptide repeat-containing protein [Planctomycetales bacterium]|nr:pentapeptide repeat-containing protein [Planctomycetales bacterium]